MELGGRANGKWLRFSYRKDAELKHMKLSIITAALISAASLAGCADSDAFFSPVRNYPMGHKQYMVTCVDSPGYCAREANKLCPQGFDVTSNVTNEADYGRMTMTINCH